MAEGSSRRVQRYEKLVRQITSEFLITRVNELEMGWAQVTRVQVSADLRRAKVFVHIENGDDPKADLETLQAYAPELQKYIHGQVRSKYCPKVQFILDKSFEKVLKVEKLLFQILCT